jgi:hypothetical protein
MRVVIFLVCVAFVSCSPELSPGTDPGGGLVAHERLWSEAGLEDYRFRFHQQCFCVREQVEPVVVEVRGGRIVRVASQATGEEVPADPNLRWPTIPDLFDLVAQAEIDQPEALIVHYDARLGYPIHLEIGSLAADAGVVYTASNFEPL